MKSIWLKFKCINHRSLNPTAQICTSNVSFEANRIFLESRYPMEKICREPCTNMKIHLIFQDKTENNASFGSIRFRFRTKIEVTREIYTKTFLVLLAEIGGYLGMTVGNVSHLFK